jgi:hypothetical protein
MNHAQRFIIMRDSSFIMVKKKNILAPIRFEKNVSGPFNFIVVCKEQGRC